jgi:hypothetical protein
VRSCSSCCFWSSITTYFAYRNAGIAQQVIDDTVLTPDNIYMLCHPAQATRMDFITRSAVSWCRTHRPALAEWMNFEVFDRIMNTMASVMPGANGGQGWAEQTRFLQTDAGDAYMKTLARDLDNYIQNL